MAGRVRLDVLGGHNRFRAGTSSASSGDQVAGSEARRTGGQHQATPSVHFGPFSVLLYNTTINR